MALPTWAPSLEQVGDYVTSRTIDTNTPGGDTPTGTFSNDTYPTGDQVDRLIASACRWVASATGEVVTALGDNATDVAAMRAAGLVELSYPLRNNDVDEVAGVLLDQASAARTDLVALNRAQGGTGVNANASPLGSFPDAACWRGDEPVMTSLRIRW